MQCFELPASICSTITSLTRDFWWSTNDQQRPIYWKSWSQLCESKFAGGMGFRDIHTFNLAMLGKQAWGIWSNPSSLLARCLHVKYFANNDFLLARLGSRPSYLWRSILAGRDVLNQGLRFRVGNGESIRAFEDRWIPRPHSFKILSPRTNDSNDVRVSELIDWNISQWRVDILMQQFLPIDVEEILKIPLTIERPPDCLVWHYTKTGEYTVKSANQMLQSKTSTYKNAACTSSQTESKTFWKKLWHLPCLPKAKLFIWKASSNILATNLALSKKLHTLPSTCSLCGADEESVFHLLFQCPWAAEIWEEVDIGNRCKRIKATCFRGLLHSTFQWTDEEDISYFVHLSWLIWKNRCAKKFGGQYKGKHAILLEAKNLTSSLFRPSICTIPPTDPYLSMWIPPAIGHVAINGDVAIDPSGKCCAGIIIRNHLGQVLSAITIRLPDGLAVDHGEFLTIYHGLILARSHHLECGTVWSDSLTCINMLQSVDILHNPLGSLLMECRRLANLFQQCSFNFVRREGNLPAHLLAALGLNYEGSSTWSRSLPNCILSAINADFMSNE